MYKQTTPLQTAKLMYFAALACKPAQMKTHAHNRSLMWQRADELRAIIMRDISRAVYYCTKCVLLKAGCATLNRECVTINLYVRSQTGSSQMLINHPSATGAMFILFQRLIWRLRQYQPYFYLFSCMASVCSTL